MLSPTRRSGELLGADVLWPLLGDQAHEQVEFSAHREAVDEPLEDVMLLSGPACGSDVPVEAAAVAGRRRLSPG